MGGGGAVAVGVFGSCVLGSVVVVVSEVPCLGGVDWFFASCAFGVAGGDDGCPLFADGAVLVSVASLGCCAALFVFLAGVFGAACGGGDGGAAGFDADGAAGHGCCLVVVAAAVPACADIAFAVFDLAGHSVLTEGPRSCVLRTDHQPVQVLHR